MMKHTFAGLISGIGRSDSSILRVVVASRSRVSGERGNGLAHCAKSSGGTAQGAALRGNSAPAPPQGVSALSSLRAVPKEPS